MHLPVKHAISLLLASFLSSCGSSNDSSEESSKAAETNVELTDCPSSLPTDLEKGMKISGEIEGSSATFSCSADTVTASSQTNSLDTSLSNYLFNCKNSEDAGQEMAFWLRGPKTGDLFTVTFPWSGTNPNLTATFTLGSAELKQDSFTKDSDNVKNIAAVVYEISDSVATGKKKRVRGCMEGQFTKTTSKSSGSFKVFFDVDF